MHLAKPGCRERGVPPPRVIEVDVRDEKVAQICRDKPVLGEAGRQGVIGRRRPAVDQTRSIVRLDQVAPDNTFLTAMQEIDQAIGVTFIHLMTIYPYGFRRGRSDFWPGVQRPAALRLAARGEGQWHVEAGARPPSAAPDRRVADVRALVEPVEVVMLAVVAVRVMGGDPARPGCG